MSRLAHVIFAALLLSLSGVALAKNDQAFVHISKEAPVTLQSDRAYLLLRLPVETIKSRMMPFFLRKPNAGELAAYRAAKQAAYEKAGNKAGPFGQFAFNYRAEPNLFDVSKNRDYARNEKERVILISAKPGDYIFYGIGFNSYLWQCSCFGTVEFTAEPGKVTDLGSILIEPASEPSSAPELTAETGMGRKMRSDYVMFAVGIRPEIDEAFLPAGLRALPRVAATYHPVGPFVEPNRMLANRLATMPGVLEYREGLPVAPSSVRR